MITLFSFLPFATFSFLQVVFHTQLFQFSSGPCKLEFRLCNLYLVHLMNQCNSKGMNFPYSMYHRYVLNKQPYFVPVPVNEDGNSPPESPTDVRAREVLEEVILRRQHRLTPIPPALQTSAAQNRPINQQMSDNSLTIDDLGKCVVEDKPLFPILQHVLKLLELQCVFQYFIDSPTCLSTKEEVTYMVLHQFQFPLLNEM